ncbi:MAG: L,D-transpeptidase [Verrucomicrobiales bacterium]|nr:L,D-transpeptidase [Verrucomicrobiales bacterium]
MLRALSHRRIHAFLVRAVRKSGIRPTRFILSVHIAEQEMVLFQQCEFAKPRGPYFPGYYPRQSFLISTSSYGIGQAMSSNKTPRGLHRVARKVGAGHLAGTVFRSRQPVGFTWQGQPNASIVHRILWLEGLEPGFNKGGGVDTFNRYIYIHGFGDEMTLGRPQSHGCVHMAAADLMPLFELLPTGTLVWITER